MKNLKTKINKFWKENKEEIIITAVSAVGVCVITDYIVTKANMYTLKKIATKTIEFGEEICIQNKKDIDSLVERGMDGSEEAFEKAIEYTVNKGQLIMAKQVKETLDRM